MERAIEERIGGEISMGGIKKYISIDLVNYNETIRFRFFRWGFLFHYQEAINRIKKLWVKRWAA